MTVLEALYIYTGGVNEKVSAKKFFEARKVVRANTKEVRRILDGYRTSNQKLEQDL